MSSDVRNLEQEHLALGSAWLVAEKARVDALQQLIREHGNKCTMDLPGERVQGLRRSFSWCGGD